MLVTRCILTLAYLTCLGHGLDIRSVPYLKWLGNIPGQTGRSFDPDKDSIFIPVRIIGGNHEIIIDENPPVPNESKGRFSLFDLISKGRSDIGQFLSIQESNPKNITTPDTPNRKCGSDVEEFHIYPRFDNVTEKCYIAGKGENPCPKNMQFYIIPGETNYGICDCKLFVGSNYRPLIYSPKSNQCFHLYDKGDCEDGEWMTLDSNQTASCTKRQCSENNDPSKPWILSNSTCFQLGTNGFCNEESLIIQYMPKELEPKCTLKPIRSTRRLLNGVPTLPNLPGYKNYKSDAYAQ